MDFPPVLCIKGQNNEIILFSEEEQTFYFYDDTSFAQNRKVQLDTVALEVKDSRILNWIDISPDNTKLMYANPLLQIWDLDGGTMLYEKDVEFGSATSGMFVDNER